jgi:hypothetical protein
VASQAQYSVFIERNLEVRLLSDRLLIFSKEVERRRRWP